MVTSGAERPHRAAVRFSADDRRPLRPRRLMLAGILAAGGALVGLGALRSSCVHLFIIDAIGVCEAVANQAARDVEVAALATWYAYLSIRGSGARSCLPLAYWPTTHFGWRAHRCDRQRLTPSPSARVTKNDTPPPVGSVEAERSAPQHPSPNHRRRRWRRRRSTSHAIGMYSVRRSAARTSTEL